jgi:lipopolysaccharide export system permease protein
VLLSVMIVWMYHVLAHKPGGQPIGALERFFAVLAKRLRGMMPRVSEA